MNKKIMKALRLEFEKAWNQLPLIDSHLEAGGFEDRFRLRFGPNVRAEISIIGSPTTDTFFVRIRCECDSLGRSTEAMYKPKWSVHDGLRQYDLSDFPGAVEVDLGMLVHGRPSTYHFLSGRVADAPASVQQLYSTGDGPEYRAQRVPSAVALVSEQVREFVEPFLDAVEERAKG